MVNPMAIMFRAASESALLAFAAVPVERRRGAAWQILAILAPEQLQDAGISLEALPLS